ITAYFDSDALASQPDLVECTLSGKTRTTCLRITVTLPPDVSTGPWCPRNVADGPDSSGIWLNDDTVYDADGAFVANLAAFYDDPVWQLFDPATGDIRVTDSREACEAAARPDVDPDYNNYCVECLTSYIDPGTTQTYVIPLSPVIAPAPIPLSFSGAGVAFNGVKFDEPAPVAAILGAHTIAPFDDCGGHVNPHAGYHYHAVTGCTPEVAPPNAHASLIGFALDGVGLYARLNANGSASEDLDACGGHAIDGGAYHYHVADPGRNQIIGCHSREIGCTFTDDPDRTCDASQRRRRPPR
ncbi:MAG: YHYH protein, partial [bacterium]|nr:YHYH protein [bacterium]